MGRHSSAPPGDPGDLDDRRPGSHASVRVDERDRIRALGPVTDPLLLDAVQQELRRSRPVPQRAPAPSVARPSEAPQPRTPASPPSVAAPAPVSAPAPAAAPVAAAEPALAPAPPVRARRPDASTTDSLPVLPAAFHRGRIGGDRPAPATGAVPLPPAADPRASAGAPALALSPTHGRGPAIGLSVRAVVGGLLAGVGVSVLLSLLAIWR